MLAQRLPVATDTILKVFLWARYLDSGVSLFDDFDARSESGDCEVCEELFIVLPVGKELMGRELRRMPWLHVWLVLVCLRGWWQLAVSEVERKFDGLGAACWETLRLMVR